MAATARPRHLPLFQLHAGMILAQPIRCSNEGCDVLDLPAGLALTPASIEKLGRHGVDSACILQIDARPGEPCQPDQRAGQARVEAIFRDADLSEPGQCGLFAAIRRYRCRP